MRLRKGLHGLVNRDCGEQGVGAKVPLVRSELDHYAKAVRCGNSSVIAETGG